MNDRRFRLILVWNAVLTSLLLVSLAGNAMWVQAANDPPIKVAYQFLEQSSGSGTNTNSTLIDTGTYDSIVRAKMNITSPNPHNCLVTASAFTSGQVASFHDYAIAMDTPTNPVVASRRQVFTKGTKPIEVSTVQAFSNVTGNHTFHLVTRGSPVATVFNRSIIVICIES